MFFCGGVPFNLARNPHYHRSYLFSVVNKIDSYVPPSYNKLRTMLLQKERNNVENLLVPFKSTWKKKGSGPIFFKVVNCFGEVKDRFFISDLMQEVVNEKHCAISNVEKNEATYEEFADTRFTSIIVMLKRLKLIKKGLEAMVISEKWCTYREDDVGKATFFKGFNMHFSEFTMDPKKWWANVGAQTPSLQTLAFKLLGQPSASSCAERNWSNYSFIHSLGRNMLNPSRAQDLVFIHNNLRLLSSNSEQYEE
ncbi:hypothetical protein BRARA_B02464 [Brassica rapa]|uniref:HAT C-terminal dimerisation domain-containing protein n=1 Tax=Brassica campestris TaxID=3711 RepID=A0A398AEU8_BRACM|nr:hypothetical protein BRARA_B02464 [Brassica rapa]